VDRVVRRRSAQTCGQFQPGGRRTLQIEAGGSICALPPLESPHHRGRRLAPALPREGENAVGAPPICPAVPPPPPPRPRAPVPDSRQLTATSLQLSTRSFAPKPLRSALENRTIAVSLARNALPANRFDDDPSRSSPRALSTI